MKNTNVLNSLTVAIASSLGGNPANSAIFAIMKKSGNSVPHIGEMSIIAKAPWNNGLNGIPVNGLTDHDIARTFIFTEGLKQDGCTIYSEVLCTFNSGTSILVPVMSSVKHNTETGSWSVRWAKASIDGKSYLVNFDEHGRIIADVIAKNESIPASSSAPVTDMDANGSNPKHSNIGIDASEV